MEMRSAPETPCFVESVEISQESRDGKMISVDSALLMGCPADVFWTIGRRLPDGPARIDDVFPCPALSCICFLMFPSASLCLFGIEQQAFLGMNPWSH